MYRCLRRSENELSLTHSIVRALSPFGETHSLLMKRPVGIFTVPLKPMWENSWVKLRDILYWKGSNIGSLISSRAHNQEVSGLMRAGGNSAWGFMYTVQYILNLRTASTRASS